MKDILSNMWVKRCVSIFNVAYAAVIALLTLATFRYELVFVQGKEAPFLVIYAIASIVFLVLMIYTRDMFVTRIISILLLPTVFFMLLFNMGNWVLIIPPFIVAIAIFFAAGTRETLKVVMGTIYLLLYVLGVVAYVVCNMLFGGSTVETVLDMDLDPDKSVYAMYKNEMKHLSEVVDEDNTISPDDGIRCAKRSFFIIHDIYVSNINEL